MVRLILNAFTEMGRRRARICQQFERARAVCRHTKETNQDLHNPNIVGSSAYDPLDDKQSMSSIDAASKDNTTIVEQSNDDTIAQQSETKAQAAHQRVNSESHVNSKSQSHAREEKPDQVDTTAPYELLEQWREAQKGTLETCIADVQRWLTFLGQNIRSRLILARLEGEYNVLCDAKPNDNRTCEKLDELEQTIDAFQVRHYHRFSQLSLDECMGLQRQLQQLQSLYGCLTGIARAAASTSSTKHDDRAIESAFHQVNEHIQMLYMVLFVPASPQLIRSAKASNASGGSTPDSVNSATVVASSGGDVKSESVTQANSRNVVLIGLATKAGLWSTRDMSVNHMLDITTAIYNKAGDTVLGRADGNGIWVNPFAELCIKTLDQFLAPNINGLGGAADVTAIGDESLQGQLETMTLNALHAFYVYNGFSDPHPDVWWETCQENGFLFSTPAEIHRVQKALFHWLRKSHLY